MVERHAVPSRLLPVMTMILQSWSALRVPMSVEQCRLVRGGTTGNSDLDSHLLRHLLSQSFVKGVVGGGA